MSKIRETTFTNGMAIASLVLGIVGVFVRSLGLIPLVAIIVGFVATGQIQGGQGRGRPEAIAGIILGLVGIAIALLIREGINLVGPLKLPRW